jgi:putative flippase GtrA
MPDHARPPQPNRTRHIAGFIISGGLAFLVDVAVAKTLHGLVGWPWPMSRLLAIACAMVVAWACHRRLTFAVQTAPTLAEFGRYAGVAWSAAAVNYAVFLTVLWLLPSLDATIGIGVASVVAMAYSYLGMRFGVFGKP